MDSETISLVLKVLQKKGFKTLDITGGAPEMHPAFREVVSKARSLGVHVMDRCNLTILQEPGYEDLPEFLALHDVEIVASLPCYLEDNVDQQRGKGVYRLSIDALRKLNAVGYGVEGSGLELNLVYNPLGPYLPPSQQELVQTYKSFLFDNFGVVFNQLFTITNMPIKRFGSTLVSKGQFESYMDLLKSVHQPDNLANVMCRSLVSVDWQGNIYDCDFNQMLGLNMKHNGSGPLHLRDLFKTALVDVPITVRDHCYGCTAGQGSSCGGALS